MQTSSILSKLIYATIKLGQKKWVKINILQIYKIVWVKNNGFKLNIKYYCLPVIAKYLLWKQEKKKTYTWPSGTTLAWLVLSKHWLFIEESKVEESKD